ncbi:MAG: transcription antitermination factor NusB [Verrucomicrobiota bacterium]
MGKRRNGRILAVQFLYQIESNNPEDTVSALSLFWNLTEAEDGLKDFARPRIDGVLKNRNRLDELIESASKNWNLTRMAAVDRCILRLALWEMFFEPNVPAVVAINEAVEVAKNLSTEESGSFVNGLLDRVRREHAKELKKQSSVS